MFFPVKDRRDLVSGSGYFLSGSGELLRANAIATHLAASGLTASDIEAWSRRAETRPRSVQASVGPQRRRGRSEAMAGRPEALREDVGCSEDMAGRLPRLLGHAGFREGKSERGSRAFGALDDYLTAH